ncbi:MAG: exopolysaccharide biosynthesis protein [Pseudaminobacter sp.]|nr:exopolysaccharide biosynthesis protein [Pseudaminobacter sp.]
MTGFEAGQIDGAPRRRRPRRLSDLFAKLARDAEGRVTIGSIRDALGDRSFAALLVLFAAFNLLPLPPGASAVLGLPLLIVAAQMMYGSKRAWLPRFLAEKSLSAEQFRSVMDKVVPRLVQLEKFITPRYWPFWRKRGERIIGTMSFILALIVTLPIPLGNWLPAFAASLLGLALSERDGVLFAIGSVVGVASLAVVIFVVGAAGAATSALYGWMI